MTDDDSPSIPPVAYSSNVNDVIKTILDFFIRKFHEHHNAIKRISDFFPLGWF